MKNGIIYLNHIITTVSDGYHYLIHQGNSKIINSVILQNCLVEQKRDYVRADFDLGKQTGKLDESRTRVKVKGKIRK